MKASPFRAEAMAHHLGTGTEGAPLRLEPGWSRWSYALCVAAAAAAALFLALARVGEYASGPAVVRADGRTDLTTTAPAVVSRVLVAPGDRVAPGDLLVRFHLAQAEADVDKLERSLKAPRGGVVEEIRVREGQYVAASDVFLSVVHDEETFSVVAMLPGHHRPRLRDGMTLELELSGYAGERAEVPITSVAQRVVGAREVRRYLGQEIGDTVPVDGAVVLTEARLAARTFDSDGRRLLVHEGMPARAEVRIGSERVLFVLVPALKEALR